MNATIRTMSVLSLLTVAGAARAQQSELFMVDRFNTGNIYVVQNGSVARWFGSNDPEGPIAVYGTIRTRPNGNTGEGIEYDLFGNPTGNTYPAGGGDTYTYDGTTDGAKFNFSANNSNPNTTIYVHDRDWQNQQALFTVPNGPQAYGLGVAYDTSNGTLWLTHDGNGSNRLANYDLGGTLLSDFTFNDGIGGRPGPVAYEPATDTLWFAVENTNRILQFDKFGNQLQDISVNGLPSFLGYSAEFDLGCYPDFTGDGTLDLFDFLAYVNDFNAADPAADCTGDGTLDLFDFLCFVNAFNAGC